MPTIRSLPLTAAQREELIAVRDHALKPYLRERAAALIKIAEGMSAAQVAARGLLRSRAADTVYDWLDRYTERGVSGLSILPGRGRKPAFSPSVPNGRRRPGRHAPRRPPRAEDVRD